MQQKTPRMSVVITTYNRPDALAAVLEACFLQDDRKFEIIVAEDGGTVDTRDCIDAMRERSPVPLDHVWQPDEGYRAARARNRGALAARGDYIIFLDGDCVPQRDFIARHRVLAERGYLVTGSRILLGQRLTEEVLRERIDLLAQPVATRLRWRMSGEMNKVLQTMFRWPDLGRRRHGFSWRRIKSCNLGVWRRDLEMVNGFDESFTGWGHEDSDLVLRLFHAGIMRKDGAMATEVLHLWHPQEKRDKASSNHNVVLGRAADGTTQATLGLRQHVSAALV